MERSNTPTNGEIKEVFHDGKTAKFEWTIAYYLTPRIGHFISPTVKYFDLIWYLQIWRNNNNLSISMYRKLATSGIREAVYFTYKEADGGDGDIARNNIFPKDIGKVFGLKNTSLDKTTFSRELTITCTLWEGDSPYAEVVFGGTRREAVSCTGGRIDEHPLKGVSGATEGEDASCTNSRINEGHSKGISGATQREDASCTNSRINEGHSEDISILLEHFKNLLLSGDDHDFLIKVKEEQFRVHKCVLRARSPVFAAMFRNKMAESADDCVTIDDCDPDSFGEFLGYVYTGKVDISSASHALDLYYAGDKYDFPRLKETCVEFLKNSLTATRISDVINLAVRHDEGELLQQALVYLATHLEEVMLTVEWQRFLTGNPIQANEMCIKALQSLKKI